MRCRPSIKTVLSLIVVFTFFLRTTQVSADEWTQDAHDPQRTGYTTEEPSDPSTWSLAWTWNGPDSSGGAGNHFYNAPREARIVTGGGFVFAPAGANGLYALQKSNGTQAWNFTTTAVNASPAFDVQTNVLIIPGSNGTVYKVNTSGVVQGTYNAGSPVNKAILLNGAYIYVVSNNGVLHKIQLSTMQAVWTYAAGSTAATPPTYSSLKSKVIYATSDLYVHAVNDSNGQMSWKVKPTPNTAGFPNSFDQGWPVVADKANIVLLRMQLKHDALTSGTGPSQMYPNSNQETRNLLTSKPDLQNLFALNLDTGDKAFIPAVGYGSVESWLNGAAYGVMGSIPVVRTLADGTQVSYIHFRNGQGNPPDYRWDSHMGEMVLNSSTVPNLAAGDLRFVQMSRMNDSQQNSYVHISDEQNPLTAAGNFLFHAHWGASEGIKITDRSNARGLSYADPIKSMSVPAVVRAQSNCSDKNTTTHWTSCGLTLFQDGRYWNGPGWWTYWNTYDSAGAPQSAGSRPLYTFVAGGYVFVEGNGGDLMAFRHTGAVPTTSPIPTTVPLSTPGAPTATRTPTSAPSATPTVCKKSDINQDNFVDLSDYSILVANFLKTPIANTRADINGDGIVDLSDYSLLVGNFLKGC